MAHNPRMSRYYFHVQNQGSFARDDVGLEFDTIELARDQASDAAGEILTSDLRLGKADITFQIQVENGECKCVFTMDVTATCALS